jgi:thiol-disulfide isomerase/thioredoxin
LIASLAAFGLSSAVHAQGGGFDPAAYRGKVLYLDFWASWCGPCKLSFPFMESLIGRFSRSAFALVTVNVDHDRALADTFIRQMRSDLPVIYDPKGDIARRYKVKAMPTSVLLGPDGTVRYVHAGFVLNQTAQYEAHVQELLNAVG